MKIEIGFKRLGFFYSGQNTRAKEMLQSSYLFTRSYIKCIVGLQIDFNVF